MRIKNIIKRVFFLAQQVTDKLIPLNRKIIFLNKNNENIQESEIRLRLEYFCPNISWSSVKQCKSLSYRDIISRTPVISTGKSSRNDWLDKLRQNVFNVDYQHDHRDAWNWCHLTESMEGLPNASRRKQSHEQFVAAHNKLKNTAFSKTYLFGTGTSLEKAIEHDFSDGYRIVCNTIVRDPELWRHLDPHILVAGDAIYHFGHTEFARSFRRDALARLTEPGNQTLFIYPELFDAIAKREFKGIEDRLIPIPFANHTNIHVNLTEDFELPNLGNVLNVLLLPIGCTLTKNVFLWGFDGRSPDDKNFWSNSVKHSYAELMPALFEAHPAFFDFHIPKNNPNAYVNTVHGDILENRLCAAEQEGWNFVMMHFSWTKILEKRRVNQSTP